MGLNEKLVFYYPARIIPSKSQDLLLKSLRRLKSDVLDNSYFIMSGMVQNQGYYLELLKLAEGLPVRVITDSSNVMALYATSDVVVSSTMHRETFGKVILEGMAMKKPLLLPDSDAFKEVSKKNALFFRIGDMNDLADKINLMYRNDNLRTEMGERGIKIVNEHYNPELYKKKLLALYEVIQ